MFVLTLSKEMSRSFIFTLQFRRRKHEKIAGTNFIAFHNKKC